MSSSGVEPLIWAEGIFGLKHRQIWVTLCAFHTLKGASEEVYIYIHIFFGFLTLIQLCFRAQFAKKLYSAGLHVCNRNVPENLAATLKSKNQYHIANGSHCRSLPLIECLLWTNFLEHFAFAILFTPCNIDRDHCTQITHEKATKELQ